MVERPENEENLEDTEGNPYHDRCLRGAEPPLGWIRC